MQALMSFAVASKTFLFHLIDSKISSSFFYKNSLSTLSSVAFSSDEKCKSKLSKAFSRFSSSFPPWKVIGEVRMLFTLSVALVITLTLFFVFNAELSYALVKATSDSCIRYLASMSSILVYRALANNDSFSFEGVCFVLVVSSSFAS
jgi:hypothetical protein